MHRRLQFGMRENPASDRRDGSRLAVSTELSSHCIKEENPERQSAVALADRVRVDAHSSANAVQNKAATGGIEGGSASSEQAFGYGHSVVERPLTCEEAAGLIGVHPKTVKRMARSGGLPGHFRFGRWFFYASELDSWMRTELHSSRHSRR
jgi:excisionase family DNA binding protein